jgi:cyclic pyranopterin phosphate synthase
MPKEVFGREYRFLERSQLLSFEEIARLTAIASGLGVAKARLTGGEPLLRKDLPVLVEMLASIGGISDIGLTTNGSLLERLAVPLADAGLSRVTVSLDSLDDSTFMQMNDVGFPVSRVLGGIDAAAAAGLGPVKVNVVLKRGVNDSEILRMVRHFRGTGHIIRFIEYMDVGHSNGWRLDDVVPAAEVLETIDREHPLEAAPPNYPGEVVNRYQYRDGAGEIGVIASVTRPFCGTCTRARLSADGVLYTCLFATGGHDLREMLRSGAPDTEVANALQSSWRSRSDRYSEIRSGDTLGWEKVEMSYIGG